MQNVNEGFGKTMKVYQAYGDCILLHFMTNRDNVRCRGAPRLDVGADGFSV